MRKFLLSLMLLLSSACLQARSSRQALKRTENMGLSKAEDSAAGHSAMAIASYDPAASFKEGIYHSQPYRGMVASHLPRISVRKKAPIRYDVSRENGSYFFDTVYKLRVPATRRLLISLNGGYTYYDRYVHGFGKAGSLGMIGGISLMMLSPFKTAGKQASKKGFLRLNADLTSYPYRKGTITDGPKSSLLDKYTRELSTRVYLDARITWRGKRGAFTARCMGGITAGTEQLAGSTPLSIGLGFGYRFL